MSEPPVATTVVIPTRSRPDPLAACLDSLARQSCPPTEVIVADSSPDAAVRKVVNARAGSGGFRLRYHRCRRCGASAQRNEAIDLARGEIVFFLDDDVVCEPRFIAEIVNVFAEDRAGAIGGVSGTVVNQTFVPPSSANRMFMRWMAGKSLPQYGGRVIGPAWNHLPEDARDDTQPVDWLPSCCVAYRAEVLRSHRFMESFGEYSFAEDVHHSMSVGRERRLINTGRARLFHHDMGLRSHRRPRVLGRAQVVNRWIIMRDVMGRSGIADRFKLAMLQVYFACAEARHCRGRDAWRRTLQTWHGRTEGLWRVCRRGKSLSTEDGSSGTD